MKSDKVKNLYFGNLNMTFGKENESLLEHFESIFYPVITSETKKYVKKDGVEDSDNYFRIFGVELKLLDEEYVLTGIFEHNVKFERDKYWDNGEIIENYAELKGSNWSKFYLFLKNHRIALIKEDNKSPNLVNLKSYLKYIFDYDREKRKRKSGESIPYAVVDIVNIPLDESIETEMKKFSHISKVRLKFLTLNGKVDKQGLLDEVDNSRRETKSRHVYLTYVSPKDLDEIVETVKISKSNVEKRIDGKDLSGKPKTLKDDDFETIESIELEKEKIKEIDDGKIVKYLKKYKEILYSDEGNTYLYDKFSKIISKFVKWFY